MEIDPHTLQQILQRIHQQMRCPQCSKKVPIDFSSVRVMADSAMLLQLKCDACNAFIVLQASLQGVEEKESPFENEETENVSTTLKLPEKDLAMLHTALEKSGGSFAQLFEEQGIGTDSSAE